MRSKIAWNYNLNLMSPAERQVPTGKAEVPFRERLTPFSISGTVDINFLSCLWAVIGGGAIFFWGVHQGLKMRGIKGGLFEVLDRSSKADKPRRVTKKKR